jgi:hypothetical protein
MLAKSIFESPDETWNCAGQGVGPYASVKSIAYIAIDAAWASNAVGKQYCVTGGDFNNWTGKVGSLLGQAIRAVSSAPAVSISVQTAGNAYVPIWGANIRSQSYVGQNTADIPLQNGCAGPGAIQTYCPATFQQIPAYQAITAGGNTNSGIEIANYWANNDQFSTGLQAEVALAYCYFYQASGCASQSSLMTSYFNTNWVQNEIYSNVPSLENLWLNWFNFAQSCASAPSCPTPLVIYNYEGTYTVGLLAADTTVAITGASVSGSNTQLTAANNGAVVGMTVTVTAAAGGTWSSIVGNSYVVQSVGSGNFTINLNSSGLGTFSSMTIDYTGSSNYVSYFRRQSYLSPQLATLTTTLFNAIASTTGPCAPAACSYYPSQFNLSEPMSTLNWFDFSDDIYGYFVIGTCTSCTISTTNLTLGGTVQGIWGPGQTVFGKGLNPAPTITGTCSQTGTGPAGSNVGDVCPLSASFTVGTGETMNGKLTPPLNAAGTLTTSVMSQWPATCTWNGNGSQCLLLLPFGWRRRRKASNDNDPTWQTSKAA